MEKIKIKKDFKRPWGGFIQFTENQPSTVKILKIKKGESLSLQSHKMRDEFWYLISGKIKVKIGKKINSLEELILKEGETIFIPRHFLHQASALKNSEILEISFGKFKEEDEIRYQDKYGRK